MKFSLFSLVLLLACSDYAIAQVGISANDPYAARKVFYEQHWQRKIESALRFVDGAVVNVNVELTAVLAKRIETLEISGDPVSTSEKSEASSSNSSGGPGTNNHGGEHSEVKEEAQTTHLIPTIKSSTTLAGLVPKSVAVSVTIPSSYYETLQANNSAHADEETRRANAKELEEKIRTTVAALLPKKRGDNNLNDVIVTSFDDTPYIEPATLVPMHPAQAFTKGDVITLMLAGENSVKKGQSRGIRANAWGRQVQRIAVEIVDVKANGCLVIEGHQVTANGEHRQKLDVRGVIHASSIDPDATVSSSEVADLKLTIFETSD